MHAATQSAPQRADAPLAAAPIDERDADVVIIGGGPGGSTAGALLAQKGWRVLLLRTFTWMIYRMTSLIMRNLIMHPRDIFGVQRAVISFWAGNVYDSGPVRRRVMMFRGIYYLSAIKHWRQAWRSVVNCNNAIRPQAIRATDGSG